MASRGNYFNCVNIHEERPGGPHRTPCVTTQNTDFRHMLAQTQVRRRARDLSARRPSAPAGR